MFGIVLKNNIVSITWTIGPFNSLSLKHMFKRQQRKPLAPAGMASALQSSKQKAFPTEKIFFEAVQCSKKTFKRFGRKLSNVPKKRFNISHGSSPMFQKKRLNVLQGSSPMLCVLAGIHSIYIYRPYLNIWLLHLWRTAPCSNL